MKRRRWALSYELSEIADAIDAARMLGEAVSTNQLGSDYDQRHAPRALTAVLSLAWARVRDLNRVVRGDLDPGHLHAYFNSVDTASMPNEVVFTAADGKRRGGR